MKKILFVVIILLFSCTTAYADNEYGLEVNYWKPSLSGGVRASSSALPGTPIDYKADLGIGDKYIGDFRFRTGTVVFSYSQFDYGATKQLATQIQYNGTTYPINDVVSSSLKIKYYGAIWDTTANDRQGTTAAITFGARGIHLDGVLQSAANGKVEKSFNYTVPVVGFSVQSTNGGTQLFARISGLPAGGHGYFFDGEAGVKFSVGKDAMLTAGWRTFDVNVKKSGDVANIRLSGPYVGGTWDF